MVFRMDEKMHLGKVSLKVGNLKKQIDFYQNSIGLSLLDQSNETALLGIQETGEVLLELHEIEDPNPRAKKTGLFHTAFLLPTRKDLGNVLYSLLQKQIPIDGASDHGYSEAIYLQDPEGNGIEIYRDKSREEWDVREDGRIAGITVQMDAEGVLASRDENPASDFPEGTVIGHVHLSVSDLKATESFYTNVLGLNLTDRYGEQARFFAAGDYHHHIGTNTWLGEGIPAAESKDLGLDYYTIIVSNEESFKILKENVRSFGMSELLEDKNEFMLLDPNGITIKIENNR